MIKFPSIEQYRNVIREVKTNHDFQGKDELEQPIYQHLSPYPVLDFVGTVKLHGTNASVVKYKDRVEFQSRERVLSLQQDNYQFALSMSNKDLGFLFEDIKYNEYIAVFGEWIGQGVQSGIAVSNLLKTFVILAYKVDDVWMHIQRSDFSQNIYHIKNFPTWNLEIDFNSPESVQNRLVELTEQVEKECPVGKHFGFSGIGEGIVWATPDRRYCFKVKGEKHSSTKVKTLASVDTELIESMNEFVDNVLTESRLKQGIEKLKEMGLEVSQKSTGEYLRWIIGDVVKEEQDTIIKNQFDLKKLNPLLSNKARVWFFNNF